MVFCLHPNGVAATEKVTESTCVTFLAGYDSV